MKWTSWTRTLARLAAGMLCVATAHSSFAEDFDWKLSTSFDYESGDFGTGTRSSFIHIPFSLTRYAGPWNASVTLPFLSQSANDQVMNVGGRPARTGKRPGPTTSITHSGPGDAVVRGGWALMQEDAEPFDLSVAGKIKVPTADKDKGLGTGEFDEGLGLMFGKTVIPGWMLLTDLYFTLIGAPSGTDLNDQLAVDVGILHPLGDGWTSTLLLEGSNALVPGETAPLDLRGTLDHTLGGQGRIFAGVLLGLSDGSPDFGLSLGGSYRF